MNKNELWKLVKENKNNGAKALQFYVAYRRAGGNRINKTYEQYYQRLGTK